MRSCLIFALAATSALFAGCKTMTPTQIAAASCAGAEAAAAVGSVVTADANVGANATAAAGRAQQTAGAVQKAVGDACPVIVSGVKAAAAAGD
jgi:hypothetical protein